MLDFLIRENTDGVPVPVPGRAIMYAGPGGVPMVRLSDGSVSPAVQGPQGPAFDPMMAHASNVAEVLDATEVDAVAAEIGMFEGKRGAVWVRAVGLVTHGADGVKVRCRVVVDGVVRAEASVSLGAVAMADRQWSFETRMVFLPSLAWACNLDLRANAMEAGAVVASALPHFAITPASVVSLKYSLTGNSVGSVAKVVQADVVREYLA